jgi:hypothetical protein
MLEIALLKRNELGSQSILHAFTIVQIEGSKKKVAPQGKKKGKGQMRKTNNTKEIREAYFEVP